jgi:hypothetical protein
VIVSLIGAYILHIPSLERIIARYKDRLGTCHKSSLSLCLRRESFVRFADAMLSHLCGSSLCLSMRDIIALDSMGLTISRRRKSDAAKINDKTRGLFVIWQVIINARGGCAPVRMLKLVHKACNDAGHSRSLELAQGPIYLMDRGFWCFESMRRWAQAKVRFVVRARKDLCIYHAVKVMGQPRKIGRVQILFDGIAWVGAGKSVQMRLVYAKVGKEDLILASSLMRASAQTLLTLYSKRWQIERFHRFLKNMLGLAHLYSFQRNGMELLVRVCLIAAILLFLASKPGKLTVDTLIKQLQAVRTALGIEKPIRRNSCIRRWRKKIPKLQAQNH